MTPGEQIHALLQESLKTLDVADFHRRVFAVEQAQWEGEASLPSIVHVQSGQNEIELLEGRLVTHILYTVQLRANTPEIVEMMERSMLAAFDTHTTDIEVVSAVSGRSQKLNFYWRESVVEVENIRAEVIREDVRLLYENDDTLTFGDADDAILFPG